MDLTTPTANQSTQESGSDGPRYGNAHTHVSSELQSAVLVTNETSPRPERIESLDLLRGLCALGVAMYHTLGRLDVAHLHTVGLYGVYVFFLLSGASMTIAYQRRFHTGFSITRYLLLRYLRLAPLYTLMATAALAFHGGPAGASLMAVCAAWLLNITFLFGFANPAATSMVAGGWSLGIEFVFYTIFPVLLTTLERTKGLWLVVGLFLLQLGFVNLCLRDTELEAALAEYTQMAAFIGYFSVGVWLGILKNGNRLQAVRSHWLWLAWAAMIVAISSLSAATTTGTLIGARGGLLALLSCGLVAVTARIRVPHALKGVAAWLGEISYPLYLLHMWAYRLLAVQVSPIRTWETDTPAAFALAVIALSCLMATVSYRFFELPFLTWGKRRLGTCQRL